MSGTAESALSFLRTWLRQRPRPELEFADATRVESMRPRIDAFLHQVLPEDERETIDSSFISDEASIFDCSLADKALWVENCSRVYGVLLTESDLHLPLWRLVEEVERRRAVQT